MDISKLKEVLGDERFTELEGHITDLTNQRDQARNESIDKRKGLQKTISTMESERTELFERLGIESFDEIKELPDGKGQAEAAKQFETKIKRLERELSDEKEARAASDGRYRDSQRKIHVNGALAKHEFVDPEVVETFVSQRLEYEGDDLYYKTTDGKLISVEDGVAELAKSRPSLLKPKGAGGAGVGAGGAGGSDGQKEMTRADFDAAPQAQRAKFIQDGGKVIDAAA